MTTQFDKAGLERMRGVLRGHVEAGGVPGLVALASRGGEVHVEVLGVMDLGTRTPMQRDSLFRISSMTKPITAVAALMLVEDCRLRLDDPIDPWLPELAGRCVLRRLDAPLEDTVPARRSIRVRDLLTFTLGFGQLMEPPDAYPILRAARDRQIGMGAPHPSDMPAPDEWLRRLGELPLMAQPGERWLYNTGSDVLGVLIARASGQPLPAFLAERLFEPLGMRDTHFSVPEAQQDRLVTAYYNDYDSGAFEVYDPAAGGQWSRPPVFPSGAGGLVSTCDDFFAFARMLFDGGKAPGGRILSRASVALMLSDQLSPEQKVTASLVPGYFDSHGYGFGVSIVTQRRHLAAPIGTYGWDGGLGTTWSSDPSEGVISVLMTQRAWTSPTRPAVALDFATATYRAIAD